MSKKILQGILALLGLLFTFRFFLPGIIWGGAYLAKGMPIAAHLDSETRFLSALAGGFAVFFFYLIKDIERKGSIIRIIASAAFLGGVMRIVSIFAVGKPGSDVLFAIGIEIVLPVVVVLLQRHVAKSYEVKINFGSGHAK